MMINSTIRSPRISIVTASYNQRQFIERTIRSIVDQKYPNLEYIVIDGGSTDGSVEIIKKYTSQIAYWTSESDSGQANALNKGFAQTTGEIMSWLNSDDMLFPWTLEVVGEIFASHPEVNWITGNMATWNAKDQIIASEPIYKNKYDFLLGRYGFIQQEGTFWRRSLWEAAGGRLDETYKLMVDGELWCRFFLHSPLHHVTSLLGGFRLWGGNRSRTQLDLVHEEMRRCIDKMRATFDAQTIANFTKLHEIILTLKKGIPQSADIIPSIQSFLKEIGYDHLTYDCDAWKHTRSPYRISLSRPAFKSWSN